MSLRHTTLVLALCGLAAVATALALAITRGGSDGTSGVRPVTDPAALEARGREALALVGFDANRLGYTVRFAPGRPGVRAQVDGAGTTISVFLRDGDAPHVVAHDIAHELGHAFDQTQLTDAGRRDYLARRGVPEATWLPTSDSDYGVGAGDFAEVFSLCHAASPDFRGTLAPRPENACELLPQEAL
jgi:hypothetical protein